MTIQEPANSDARRGTGSLLLIYLTLAGCFAGFAFFFESKLQAIAPVSQWPLMGQAMHYLAPLMAVLILITVAFLSFARTAEVFMFRSLLKEKRAQIGLAVLALAQFYWLTWATIGMPVDLAH